MKKFTLTALVLVLALAVATPAMALSIITDGYFRVSGYTTKNYTMDKNDNASDSRYSMRLRVNNQLVVSDKLKVVTRFRALNRNWGGDNDDLKNFQVERIFMVVKTPIGAFSAGRMNAGAWGTSFRDSEGDADRLKLVTKAGPLTLIFIIQKSNEEDVGTDVGDADYDVYFAAAIYKQEGLTAGILFGWIDDARASEGVADPYHRNWLAVLPYAIINLGPVTLTTEARWDTGTFRDFESSTDDIDINAFTIFVEAVMDLGPATVQVGGAYASGDDDGFADDDIESAHFGDDWEKLYLLTGSTGFDQGAFGGGLGNFSQSGSNPHGALLIYAGASMSPMEALTVAVVAGISWATEEPSGADDFHGWEIDLQLTWKPYDNLKYQFIAAYLDAGDYWEDAAGLTGSFEDSIWSLFHRVTLSF